MPRTGKSENYDKAFSRNLQVYWFEKTEFPKSVVRHRSGGHSENLAYQRNRYALADCCENRKVENTNVCCVSLIRRCLLPVLRKHGLLSLWIGCCASKRIAIFSCLLMRPTSLRVGKPSLRRCRFATEHSLCFSVSIKMRRYNRGSIRATTRLFNGSV